MGIFLGAVWSTFVVTAAAVVVAVAILLLGILPTPEEQHLYEEPLTMTSVDGIHLVLRGEQNFITLVISEMTGVTRNRRENRYVEDETFLRIYTKTGFVDTSPVPDEKNRRLKSLFSEIQRIIQGPLPEIQCGIQGPLPE